MSSLSQIPDQNSIFLQNPRIVCFNEDGKTRYSTSGKIEDLIAELREKGVHLGLGKMGPASYEKPPSKLKDQKNGQDVWGWEKGAKRIEYPKNSYMFVLGAEKNGDRELVYITPCEDITADPTIYVRNYQASQDDRIYATSHRTFHGYLVDFYPPRTISISAREDQRVVANSPKKIELDQKRRELEEQIQKDSKDPQRSTHLLPLNSQNLVSLAIEYYNDCNDLKAAQELLKLAKECADNNTGKAWEYLRNYLAIARAEIQIGSRDEALASIKKARPLIKNVMTEFAAVTMLTDMAVLILPIERNYARELIYEAERNLKPYENLNEADYSELKPSREKIANALKAFEVKCAID